MTAFDTRNWLRNWHTGMHRTSHRGCVLTPSADVLSPMAPGSGPYFASDTLDDVMHDAIEAILLRGERVKPTKGWMKELRGVVLEISDARARLSRTETRGKPFSGLGELCWYLAGTDSLDFIAYYLPLYEEFAEDDRLYGAYGPRLFGKTGDGLSQVESVLKTLRRKPSSRQAVIQLFHARDIVTEHKDVPCTCTLQFMVRNGRLELVTHMRSNDAFKGLPHDVFSFTMLQEILARSLSIEPGVYKHMVGSLHVYEEKVDEAQEFLDEGFQSTGKPMPAMPVADPWPAIQMLGNAEEAIRNGGSPDPSELASLDPYWADLVRLLQVYRAAAKNKDARALNVLRDQMVSEVYRVYIDERLRKLH